VACRVPDAELVVVLQGKRKNGTEAEAPSAPVTFQKKKGGCRSRPPGKKKRPPRGKKSVDQ